MSGNFPSIVQDGLTLPDIDLACILEVLLDSLGLSQKAGGSCGQEYLCTNLSCVLTMFIPGLGNFAHSHSFLVHFLFGLLQCTAHGLSLMMTQNLQLLHNIQLWCTMVCSCNIITLGTELAPNRILSVIPMANYHLGWVTYRMAYHQLFLPTPQGLTKQTCSRSLL